MKVNVCSYLVKQVKLNENSKILVNTKPVVGVFDDKEGTITDDKDGRVYTSIDKTDKLAFFMFVRSDDLKQGGATPEDYFSSVKNNFYYCVKKNGKLVYKEFNTDELDAQFTNGLFDIVDLLTYPNEYYDAILDGKYDYDTLVGLDSDLDVIESNVGHLRGAISEVVGDDEDSYQYSIGPKYYS